METRNKSPKKGHLVSVLGSLLFCLLALTLVLKPTSVEATMGLGLSRYDVDLEFYEGTEGIVYSDIAVAYNTGDIDYLLVCSLLEGDPSAFTVKPESKLLVPGENTVVFIQFHPNQLEVGDYNFTVEIVTERLQDDEVSGNLVIPGGTVSGSFTIIENPFEPPILEIGVAGLSVGALGIFVTKRRRRGIKERTVEN